MRTIKIDWGATLHFHLHGVGGGTGYDSTIWLLRAYSRASYQSDVLHTLLHCPLLSTNSLTPQIASVMYDHLDLSPLGNDRPRLIYTYHILHCDRDLEPGDVMSVRSEHQKGDIVTGISEDHPQAHHLDVFILRPAIPAMSREVSIVAIIQPAEGKLPRVQIFLISPSTS